MLDAVRNLCNQRFPASSLEMFSMQDQRGGVVEAAMNSMHFAATTGNASTSCSNRSMSVERGRTGSRPHPHPSQVLKCPRCDSLNTKFCYYNNYNLSQPRHFCKSCRRYWTKGGVLRNIPVGGGCRKTNHNKKSKPRSNAASTPHNRNPIPKSASNSTATVSSTESSPITVNNDTTSSSNSSVNISDTDRTSHSHVFGSELQEILKQTEIGNLAHGTVPPEVPVPRLFSGLDYLSQPCPPNFPAAKNLSENINVNSSFSSLIGSSNFVGTTFSVLQSKLQQEKTAAVSFNDARTPAPLNSETLQKPSYFAELLSGYTTNNSSFSHDNLNNINNNNNIIPLEWQVNDKSEFLLEEEEPYWWGAEAQVNWLNQTQFAYPNQDF